MQQSNAPAKLVLPFANSGARNTIPAASQIGITPGAASLTDGFPPLTRTPLVSGGVPPSGLDMNGVLFAATAVNRWANAGGRYNYDSAFSTSVGGYPKGAVVLATDGVGGWLNIVENNTTDPDAGGAGWVPDFTYGSTAITMTNANVTLTALQAAKPIIVISGTLTANLNLILPAYVKDWLIVNNCTGNFTITAKTAAGSGVVVPNGQRTGIYGDGTNIGNTADFTASLSGSGWQRLPSGLIIQWSNVALTTTLTGFSFPIAFPNAIYSMLLTNSTGNNTGIVGAASATLTGFNGIANAGAAGNLHYYIAIGR